MRKKMGFTLRRFTENKKNKQIIAHWSKKNSYASIYNNTFAVVTVVLDFDSVKRKKNMNYIFIKYMKKNRLQSKYCNVKSLFFTAGGLS